MSLRTAKLRVLPIFPQRSCMHCDYDLRGQQPDGVCPECGHPVRDAPAVLSARHLTSAERPWLRWIRIGWLLLVCSWPVSVWAATWWLAPLTTCAALTLALVGLAMATARCPVTPEPPVTADVRRQAWRRFALTAVVCVAVAMTTASFSTVVWAMLISGALGGVSRHAHLTLLAVRGTFDAGAYQRTRHLALACTVAACLFLAGVLALPVPVRQALGWGLIWQSVGFVMLALCLTSAFITQLRVCLACWERRFLPPPEAAPDGALVPD